MRAQEFNKVFDIHSESDFNSFALKIFEFQYYNCDVYRKFADNLSFSPGSIKEYSQIPFLPVEFFKSHEVLSCQKTETAKIFTSSTTTSQTPSRHIVNDIRVYEESFLKGFELFYGEPNKYCILALLPGYLERKGSSLVYMFEELIKLSGDKRSGFFLTIMMSWFR